MVYWSLDLDHFITCDELRGQVYNSVYEHMINIQYQRSAKCFHSVHICSFEHTLFRWRCAETFPWTPCFYLHNPNINISSIIHITCLSTLCTTCNWGFGLKFPIYIQQYFDIVQNSLYSFFIIFLSLCVSVVGALEWNRFLIASLPNLDKKPQTTQPIILILHKVQIQCPSM